MVLRFEFPNWTLALPGQPYDGDDPEGFASRDEVVAFIERYADRIAAPVRTGVRVALRAAPGPGRRFRLETSEGVLEAANVVVATGPSQVPVIPAWAGALPAGQTVASAASAGAPGRA
jgi:putative flavoprotein involved in K+ transport